MKNTFRKSLSMIIALMMIVAVMLSATACGGGGGNGGDPDDKGSAGRNDFIESLGGVSDTFAGAVSDEGYETAEEAAVAFVSEEVAGESEVTVVNAVSKGEVSASSINIPEEYTEGIVSVEEYEVEYSLNEGVSFMAEGVNSNKKVKVYIIKYESEWKYFTPAPITGETISKSYYDSVFNAEKYKNCTYKTEMSMVLEVVSAGGGLSQAIDMTMSMSQLVKHADGKLYMEMTYSMSSSTPELIGSQGGTTTLKIYVEEVEGVLVCYADIGDGEGWRETELGTVGFGSLDELTPFNDQYIDYSYFTKTDYGFKIADENAAKFIDELYSDLLLMYDESFALDMFAEYYVSEGTLTGMRMDMDMDINVSEAGAVVTGGAEIDVVTTCTNYGTTVVEKPAV